ncbi:MAG: hypothetical protein ACT4P6_21760 [Gemmatimonadaceae bacterium]
MTHAAALEAAPARGAGTRERVRVDLLCGAGLALLAAVIFANALGHDFVRDDRGVLLGNPLVESLAQSWRAFTLPYWPEALGGGQYRPLGILSFALDWRLGGGAAAWFHATNVIWHALATVLVWRLATQLMRPWAAVLSAALFAVHPVHVEAVASVVGRLDPMATVFTLGMVLAHRASSLVATPLFALALLSKESAIVGIGLVLLSDILRPQTSDLRPPRKLYIGYGIVLAAYAATLLSVFQEREFRVMTGSFADASLTTRLATMATVLPHYVRLLLFPAQLSSDYEPQVIPAVDSLTIEGGIGLLVIVSYVTTLFITWRRHRPLAFALLWIGVTIAPVSNILFVSGVTLAERTLYMPSVGAMLALGIAGESVAHRRRELMLSASAALLLAGALRTWTRTPVWRDDKVWLLTLLEDHPESFRAHWVAGRVHSVNRHYDDAQRELALARRLYPKATQIYLDAAAVADMTHDPATAAALRDSATTLMRTTSR